MDNDKGNQHKQPNKQASKHAARGAGMYSFMYVMQCDAIRCDMVYFDVMHCMYMYLGNVV